MSGIIGQKWYVRRFQPYPDNYSGRGVFKGKKYPTQDLRKDHTVKSGTKVYTVTTNPNQRNKDFIYWWGNTYLFKYYNEKKKRTNSSTN